MRCVIILAGPSHSVGFRVRSPLTTTLAAPGRWQCFDAGMVVTVARLVMIVMLLKRALDRLIYSLVKFISAAAPVLVAFSFYLLIRSLLVTSLFAFHLWAVAAAVVVIIVLEYLLNHERGVNKGFRKGLCFIGQRKEDNSTTAAIAASVRGKRFEEFRPV